MTLAILMPKLGMTMEEGTVIEWPLAIGERVEKGDTILIIESEKAEVEIEASVSGYFRHSYVDEGETVPCGVLLGAITPTDDEAFDADAFRAAEDASKSKVGGSGGSGGAGGAKGATDEGGLQVKTTAVILERPEAASSAAVAERPVVPAARAAARKLGIDPQNVPGTGPNGRITKQDVEAYAAAREALVSVADGVSLEVLVAGAGDPVILLPGLGTDVSAFARQIPVLTQGYRVLGVNPRGVGLSDAPDSEVYEVAQTALDAAAVFEGAAHVIGASLGAAAAIELAILRPDRIKTLTLITPFVEATPRLAAIAAGWQRLAAEATPAALALALLPWFFSSSFLADESARTRSQRGLAQTLARVPAPTLTRMIAGMANWSGSRTSDLSRISVPTLVVAAGEDLLTPDAATIAEAIPGAKLLCVEDAGHAVALEAPETVNPAITAHLA